jgi:signal peptidase I
MALWILLTLLFPAAAAVIAVLAARRHFVVVRVSGVSMAPAFLPGDRVLVRRGAGDRVRTGTVVVLWPPEDDFLPDADRPSTAGDAGGGGLLIKRIAAIPGDAVPKPVLAAVGGTAVVPAGMLVVLGDNARSSDSRLWGFFPVSHVAGSVVRRLSPVDGSRLQKLCRAGDRAD